MTKGDWSRAGRGMCEIWSLEIGEVYRASVIRRDIGLGDKPTWEATVNRQNLGVFQDKDAGIRAVETEIQLGMKRLDEDWAVCRAIKLLAMQGRRITKSG